MNRSAKPLHLAFTTPWGAFSGPHLQRLAERWLRQWIYALSGGALGLWMGGLVGSEVRERHAQSMQTVARLNAQLQAFPVAVPTRPEMRLPSDARDLLARLPAQTHHGQIWADWQQVLQGHGLRLQSLRPVGTLSNTAPISPHANASASVDGRSGLSSQVAALQVLGRFEDWTRVWAACAELGPICSIDRISVVLRQPPAEVQIDAVLRFWMRTVEGDVARDSGPSQSEPPTLVGLTERGAVNPVYSPVVLFSRHNAGDGTLKSSASMLVEGPSSAEQMAAAATSPEVVAAAVLPQDPSQWPLARVRWLGHWQLGADRLAILSAGTHWAKVTQGQRVTLEGHRVVAITEDGVSLRLASGPVFKLGGVRQSEHIKEGQGAHR